MIYDTLVLSGGGLKGIATLGALHYLQLQGKIDNIHYYVGTSVGSIICYLLIIGYTPLEILIHICQSETLKSVTLSLNDFISKGQLINYEDIQQELDTLTLNKLGRSLTFQDMYDIYHKELTVATFNLNKEAMDYINYHSHPNMPVLVALRMSSNIPLVFGDFKYKNESFIDGGFGDNFALDYYPHDTHTTIGIYIRPYNRSLKDCSFNKDFLSYVMNLLFIPNIVRSNERIKIGRKLANCLIIEIDTVISSFKVSVELTESLDMFSLGYRASKAELENKHEANHRLDVPVAVATEEVKEV